ncbi:tetratricopeptide repeat protein [Amycolatopsis sp. NPDC026612]|uniref:ATP-binding protein n=1 Tax=Amycolatopsis sp. NPDC026612 TaxID=3155466 RepID=UPI0033CBA598
MFGQIVRSHRQRLGITQAELAGKTGVSERSIRNIEAGRIARPRPGTVRLLADAFALCGTERDSFHQAALADPGSGPAAAEADATDFPAGRLPRWPRPAQLPADMAGFTGRGDSLRRLTAFAEHRGGPAVVVVTGPAGVGKTTLAVHWAHRVAERFGDGQLFMNLGGFGPAGAVKSPEEAIRAFLAALDVPPGRVPADPQAQAGLYRSLLADKRVLVVLDNASDLTQVYPLIPGSPGCLVMVTSRTQLTGVVATHEARLLPLDLFTASEARQFLAHRLGSERALAESDAVDDLIALSARLPLALAVLAARASLRVPLSLAALAEELRAPHDNLDPFTADAEIDVRKILSWSYRALHDMSARLFRLLSLHPGPDITCVAAANLLAVPPAHIRPPLSELTRTHLITEHIAGRYSLHDLLRTYATELTRTHDPAPERRAALRRVLDHYLHTAHSAARLLEPTREPITLLPCRPGVTLADPADKAQALAWFTTEHPALTAIVRQSVHNGFDSHTWRLAWTFSTFATRQGLWHEHTTAQQCALVAAQRLCDQAAAAGAHHALARGYLKQCRYDDAHTHLRHALGLYRALGDPIGQARAHDSLSYVLGRQGHSAAALHHAHQAFSLFAAAGHQSGQAQILNGIGWLHARLGDYEQALGYCHDALALVRRFDDGHCEASTWDSLGYAYHHLGQHQQAITCYQRALALFREAGDRYLEADTLSHFAEAYQTFGNHHAAHATWQQALTILDELHHPDAEQVRARLHDPDDRRRRPPARARYGPLHHSGLPQHPRERLPGGG